MYIRVWEITSPSKMAFEMTVTYLEHVWSAKGKDAGLISMEFVKFSDNNGMLIINYPDEKTAKNAFSQNKEAIDEHYKQNKTIIKEGDRLFRVDY